MNTSPFHKCGIAPSSSLIINPDGYVEPESPTPAGGGQTMEEQKHISLYDAAVTYCNEFHKGV